MVRTPSGLKPGSTARNKAKLFINSPAPTSNTSAKAISATTSALRRRCRAKLAVEARLLSFSASATSAFAALHAGINPKTTPVSNDNSSENVSTYPSMPIAVSRGRLAGFNAVRRSTPHIARTTPSAPPSAASNTLSTISWRTSLKRPAPSAARITISRGREPAPAARPKQNKQRPAHVTNQQLLKRHHHAVAVLVLLRILLREPLIDCGHLGLSFTQTHAWLQSQIGAQKMNPSKLGSNRIGNANRRPQVRLFARHREVSRQYADYRVAVAA